MSRKETPDILGALMGGAIKPENQPAIEQESVKAEEQALRESVKKDIQKAIKLSDKVPVKQAHFEGMETPDPIQASVSKEKATFNLSKTVLNDLEDVWMEIRKLRADKRISKTDIVEQSISDAIKDFKLKRELGKFYSKLASNKAGK